MMYGKERRFETVGGQVGRQVYWGVVRRGCEGTIMGSVMLGAGGRWTIAVIAVGRQKRWCGGCRDDFATGAVTLRSLGGLPLEFRMSNARKQLRETSLIHGDLRSSNEWTSNGDLSALGARR